MNVLYIISAILLCLLILETGLMYREWMRLQKRYNQSPLTIRTFDGTDSPYHPSVIYFKEGWQGHKYYLAETPFCCAYPDKGENYRDRFECPSIHVSDDGIHWNETSPNPIDQLSEQEVTDRDYFSDPHLVYDGERMECWYRINHRHGDYEQHRHVCLLRKISTDGVHWSDREILADLTQPDHPLGKMLVSPAILFRDGTYRMWYVDDICPGQRHIAYSCASEPHSWNKATVCTLNGYDVNPWHIDVSFIDGVYRMVVFDRIDLSLWESTDGISFEYVKSLLLPSRTIGSFYYRDLYRSCMIGTEQGYRVYFSANDTFKTSIGILEGPAPEELEIVSIDEKPYCTFKQFFPKYTKLKTALAIGNTKRFLYLYGKRPIVEFLTRHNSSQRI